MTAQRVRDLAVDHIDLRRNEWEAAAQGLYRDDVTTWQEYLRVLRKPKEWVDGEIEIRGTAEALGATIHVLSDVPERDRTFNDGQALVLMVANYQNVHFEPVTPMQQVFQENQVADADQEGQRDWGDQGNSIAFAPGPSAPSSQTDAEDALVMMNANALFDAPPWSRVVSEVPTGRVKLTLEDLPKCIVELLEEFVTRLHEQSNYQVDQYGQKKYKNVAVKKPLKGALVHTYEIGLNVETGAGYKKQIALGVTTESDTAALLRSACLIDRRLQTRESLRLWIEWVYQVGEDACEEWMLSIRHAYNLNKVALLNNEGVWKIKAGGMQGRKPTVAYTQSQESNQPLLTYERRGEALLNDLLEDGDGDAF